MFNNNTVANNHTATAHIKGIVSSVYQGKKYGFVTIRVNSKNGSNYDLITVITTDKVNDSSVGTEIEVNATISTFYDSKTKRFDVKFVEKK
jgi:hypothetical protein